MLIGIDDFNFYVPNFYLPLKTLAKQKGESPDKYHQGLGQRNMAVPPLDEDVVTMAANAAYPLLKKGNNSTIKTLLFATESSVDQSKSAGLFVHKLLQLPSNMRIIELKQACYSATAALQLAYALVAQNPQDEVLIIASDIARYGINTPGEPTQGSGAIAMRITVNPTLLAINPGSGCYSEDIMDFWRPNYMDTAIVFGKYSAQKYLAALKHCWSAYQSQGGKPFHELYDFCFHLPFCKMAEKANKVLSHLNGQSDVLTNPQHPGILYNREIGNTYSASLYISLLSFLEHTEANLSNQHLGLFSYGSGCVGEFFTMTIQPTYKNHLRTAGNLKMLENRTKLTYAEYKDWFNYTWPTQGEHLTLPQITNGRYRIKALQAHCRLYDQTLLSV